MKVLWKIVTCWGVLVIALPLAQGTARLLQFHLLQPPQNTPAPAQLFFTLLARLVLVAGLVPLALGLSGSLARRSLAFIAFLFLAAGVNTVIEGSLFTTFFHGALASTLLLFSADALFLGLSLGLLFGSDQPSRSLGRHDFAGWTLRTAAAWLAFPLVYFLFGLLITPVVAPSYNGAVSGLHVPPLGAVFEAQLIRGFFLLAASLPLIALWKGSRRALWIALGLANSVAAGLCGLIAATFLPPFLRAVHGLAVTVESFVYAAILVLLLTAPAAAAAAATPVSERRPEVHA